MAGIPHPKTLADKVALVTGASSGIGRATALELAWRGAKVVASARRKSELDTLVAEIKKDDLEATAVVAGHQCRDERQRFDRHGGKDLWSVGHRIQQCGHGGAIHALRRSNKRNLQHDLQRERPWGFLVDEI